MRRRTLAGLALVSLASACASTGSPPFRAPDTAGGFASGAGGVKLHYVLDGTAGDTVIVLHGGPGLTARRGTAPEVRRAALDSIIPSAADPYPACREQMRLFLRGVAATPESAQRIRGDGCAGTLENLRAHELVNRLVFQSIATDSGGSWDWRGRTAAIAMPALVVHGADDPLPLGSAEELAAALPGSRLVVIPGAGHYPHAEQPAAFFPPIESFLDGE